MLSIVVILISFEYYVYAILILVCIGLLILYKFLFHFKNISVSFLVYLCAGIFIFVYIHQKVQNIQNTYISGFIYQSDLNQNIKGTIIEFPEYKFSNNQYILQIENTQTYVQVLTQLHQIYNYLDILEVSGKVKDVRLQDQMWHRYYQKLGVQYSVLYPIDIVLISNSPQTTIQYIKYKLFQFKQIIRQKSNERFSSYTSALVLGMLLGEKNELSKEEKDMFNSAQLSHILVVSGYNVSLVIMLLFWLMSSMHRYSKVVGALITICLFVFLIGYDASVVRAGLMGALLVIARITNRPKSVINTLYIVASIMIFHNPLVLFDAGFHLSFIATYALLIMPSFKKISEYILSTVWIFLFVAPYILFMSGSISFIGIISNIIVLFVIPFFMLLSLVSLVLSVGDIFIGIDVFILDVLSRYIFFIAQKTQHVSAVSFQVSSSTIYVWYLILFSLLIFFQNRYTTEEYITKKYQISQK